MHENWKAIHINELKAICELLLKLFDTAFIFFQE